MCACVRARSLIAPTGRQHQQPSPFYPPSISSTSLVTRTNCPSKSRRHRLRRRRRKIGGQVSLFCFYFPSFPFLSFLFSYYLFICLSVCSFSWLPLDIWERRRMCASRLYSLVFLFLIFSLLTTTRVYFSLFSLSLIPCFVCCRGRRSKCADNSGQHLLSRLIPEREREREIEKRLWNWWTWCWML